MASTSSSPTTFTDLHPLIIQTQILPRLDGRSLSSVATTSSYLRSLCADDILWSDICKSDWPSITHPRIHHLISTFPDGYRSFFQGSFQPPITAVKHHVPSSTSQPGYHPWPSELISAVDIHYHGKIVYSRVEFTDTTADFLTSELRIVLKDDHSRNPSSSIDKKVDKVLHADDAIISHLRESVTLNWILIDPIRKRTVNLSSIKPILAWVDNEIHIRYVVVLPGNEMVECRIEVTFGVGKGRVALQVREVMLHVQDMACNCITGKDFLVITRRAFLEKYNIGKATAMVEVGSDQSKLVKIQDFTKSWLDNYRFDLLIIRPVYIVKNIILLFIYLGFMCYSYRDDIVTSLKESFDSRSLFTTETLPR